MVTFFVFQDRRHHGHQCSQRPLIGCFRMGEECENRALPVAPPLELSGESLSDFGCDGLDPCGKAFLGLSQRRYPTGGASVLKNHQTPIVIS